MRWVVAAIIALATVLAACGDDNPASSPSATLTPSQSTTSTPGSPSTDTPTPSPEPPNLIHQGPDIDFPADMAMIIEVGCWGCDGGPGGFVRVYRDASGETRMEPLLGSIQNSLPKHTIDTPNGPQEYSAFISGSAMTQDASVMAVIFCIKGSCVFSGLGSFDADSEGVAFRSLDGGITWAEIARGGPVFSVSGVLADGRVVIAEGEADDQHLDYRLEPNGGALTPPVDGAYPITSAVEVLWGTNDGRISLSDGRVFFKVPFLDSPYYYHNQILGGFSGLEKGTAFVYWRLPIPYPPPSDYHDAFALALLDVGGGSTRIVRQWQIDNFVAYVGWLAPAKDDARIILTLADYSANSTRSPLPAIVDLNAGTFNLIKGPFVTDTPPYSVFGRTFVRAVQTGPFARVVNTGSCLNIRTSASSSGDVLTCAADGVLLRANDQTTTADGLEWLRVTSPAGQQGWASTQFLER
jgi:hypothetical protein